MFDHFVAFGCPHRKSIHFSGMRREALVHRKHGRSLYRFRRIHEQRLELGARVLEPGRDTIELG